MWARLAPTTRQGAVANPEAEAPQALLKQLDAERAASASSGISGENLRTCGQIRLGVVACPGFGDATTGPRFWVAGYFFFSSAIR
jgi:hypothetical protein